MSLRALLDGLPIPILQAPMVGASPPAMALAVSQAGGMGSLAAGALAPDAIEPEVAALRAAGAAPFAAAIPNLDILGLCDAYIAKHGDVVSARPGHQRRAQLSYVLGKHPTFLFWDDGDYPSQRPLHYESKWVSRGYLWVEAELQNGAVHHFLLDESLAEKLRGTPHIRVASPRDP